MTESCDENNTSPDMDNKLIEMIHYGKNPFVEEPAFFFINLKQYAGESI